MRSLEGFVVTVTADRRADEQAELLSRRGATVLHAPSLATHLTPDRRSRDATAAVIRRRPTHVVVSTGVGVRAWFEAAQTWGLDDDLLAVLSRARIIARGPKAVGALEALGLRSWRRAPDEKMAGVAEILRGERLIGGVVAAQCDGSEDSRLQELITDAGADLVEVPVYRWGPPADERAVVGAIEAAIDERVDAVTFTSAPAVRHWFEIAARHGLDEHLASAIRKRIVVACVGPVCARAAIDAGVESPVVPTRGRLGLLVRSLSDVLQCRAVQMRLAGVAVTVQGTAALIGDQRVQLSSREAALFQALVQARGAALSRSALVRAAWPSGTADEHTVDVTVARLRRRLGPAGRGLQTIRRRGYRLAPGE